MKKDLNRALNTFAAMDSLPEGMIAEAENALIAAEGRLAPPVKKPKGGFARFMSSGWCAAVLSGVVAIGVLIFIIRAGQEPPAYQPPVKPAGCTIEMADEGADFTLSMEQESYPDGTNRLTVVMTAISPGKRISMWGGWHLERLTEDGAEVVEISYTEETLLSAKPGRKEYATLTKAINGTNTGGGFPAGTYRLHATRFDGEKYVSVAWCTFTIGDPEGETRPILDYPPAEEQAYTVTTPASIEQGATGLPITVKAAEPGVDLMPHRKYSIVKLAGPANGEGADWLQTLEGVLVRPDEAHGGYAVYDDMLTLLSPEDWLPGLYRLYALNFDGEYVDYCDFVIYEEGHIPLTTDDPDRIVVPGIFLWANNTPMIVMMDYYDGLYPEPNPAYAAVAVMYPILLVNDHRGGGSGMDLHSGSVVEVEIGKKLTYPHYGDLYALRVVTEGTLNDVDPDWLIFLQEAGYTIRETAGADLPYAVSLTRTLYAEGFTTLSVTLKAYEAGVGIGGGNQWALYRVEGEERTLIGSRSTEEAFEPPEVAPDEFCEVSRTVSIPDLTGGETLPAGRYELVYDPNGFAVPLPFTVVEDPDKQLISGTFLWVNGDPMLWDGGEYLPIHLLPATEDVSFDGLTTGYYVEVIVGDILETAPPTTQVHRIVSRSGYTSNPDLPAYVEWLSEMGYTVTEEKE